MSDTILAGAPPAVNPPPTFRVDEGARLYDVHGPEITGIGPLWATCRTPAIARVVAEALELYFETPAYHRARSGA